MELSITERTLVTLVAAMAVALVLGVLEVYSTRSITDAAIVTLVSCAINALVGFGLMITIYLTVGGR